MSKEKKECICCAHDLKVVIPYKDYEKLVNSVKEKEELQRQYDWTKKEIKAIRSLLTETWAKIGEIDKAL